jgi:nitrogen fixation/metabolism regulation signal transduction histidine kinase
VSTSAEHGARVDLDLERAVRELQGLGSSLFRSYSALEQRAERVERELARANRELASKVSELDAVSADLQAVLAALPTGVIVRDASGRIVRANSAALAVLGAREDELLGATETALDRAAPRRGAEASEWSELDLVGPDGRVKVVARRRSSVPADPERSGAARGDGVGSVEILDDRTRMTELAERLHALDKLAALGNMAGGIAHELRNPMMAVQGFASLLAARLSPESEERRWASLIVEGAREADAILTSMLSLATPEKLVLSTVEPDELVRSAERLARLDHGGEACECALEVSVSVPAFAGDRIKLRQALRNLITNAIHAQQGQAQHGRARVAVELARDADDVVATVSDAGPGIARELRTRVLEPFFTTRAEGTGLGLALVQRIAELHGGRVEISPEPSFLGGAQVRLRIPFRPLH